MHVVTLMGPTASGKTALSIAAGQGYPIEIVSVDAVMIYQGMAIGTGQPTLSEQGGIPHHLLGFRDPRDPYSAADFCRDTHALIQAIHARGRLPVLVGGTMMYYKALVSGIAPMPSAQPALRAALTKEMHEHGLAHLHARLMACDPIAAQKIRPTDSQRVLRALEVCLTSDQPISALWAQTQVPTDYQWHQVALMVEDRPALHAGIEKRFDKMCTDGFVAEVAALRALPGIQTDLPAIRAVGYRQIWQYLEGQMDKALMREKAITATRQLAKRQMTWLRQWPDLHCLSWDSVTRMTDFKMVIDKALCAQNNI